MKEMKREDSFELIGNSMKQQKKKNDDFAFSMVSCRRVLPWTMQDFILQQEQGKSSAILVGKSYHVFLTL